LKIWSSLEFSSRGMIVLIVVLTKGDLYCFSNICWGCS